MLVARESVWRPKDERSSFFWLDAFPDAEEELDEDCDESPPFPTLLIKICPVLKNIFAFAIKANSIFSRSLSGATSFQPRGDIWASRQGSLSGKGAEAHRTGTGRTSIGFPAPPIPALHTETRRVSTRAMYSWRR